MEKRYFGSYSLQNTIRKVKENFPECVVLFKEDDGKYVTFKFDPETRKKYKLSETIRTYQFLNNHLILSNGCIDPFKYDKLDELIETTELQYDINKQKDSIEKIVKALNSCQEFHDTAMIDVGNQHGKMFDIRLTLNEIPRYYHVDMTASNVHLQKLNNDTVLNNLRSFKLSKLPSDLQYKILKTTHPGLKTIATEYISGLRDDKAHWTSSVEAYVKPWKKDVYEQMGISPFDVLADVSESRLVGKFVNDPKRHLILYDGSEYVYSEMPLEIMPYEDYKKERNMILNQYKQDIMFVCKETGIMPQEAIDVLNIYNKKIGPMIFKDKNEAVNEIKINNLKEPLLRIINRLNRSIKLQNPNLSFNATLRKNKENDNVRRIDINEKGTIIRFDFDMKTLILSEPYIMSLGHKRTECNLKKFQLVENFMNLFNTQMIDFKNTIEYKNYQFMKAVEQERFISLDIIEDGTNIYQTFLFPDKKHKLFLDPYKKIVSVDSLGEIQNSSILSEQLNKAIHIYDELFS